MSPSRFIAIAVGRGDAFFFERDGKTALIDGGGSERGFATQFRNTTGVEGVDVLVCTHNDADHSLGLLGFLECGLTAREVWLPSSWLDRLDDLLLRPREFFGELIRDIEYLRGLPEEVHLADLGDIYSNEREIEHAKENKVDKENLEDALEVSEAKDSWSMACLLSLLQNRPWKLLLRNHKKLDSFSKRFQQLNVFDKFT